MKRIDIGLPIFATRCDVPRLAELPKPILSRHITYPITHALLAHSLIDAIADHKLSLVDSFHAYENTGDGYYGFFELKSRSNPNTDYSHIIGVYNRIDKITGVDFYYGMCSLVNKSIVFYRSGNLRMPRSLFEFENLGQDIDSIVTGIHEQWSIIEDRMSHYQKLPITQVAAHDITCHVIREGIMAGREINDFLVKLDKRVTSTMWTLYTTFGVILNKLNASQLLDRTLALTEFFDSLTKFNTSKATKWEQATLV